MVVSWPWPMVWVPVISDTLPSGSKRISTFSVGAPPVALMWQARPMPRRLPFASLAARRAGKAARSARSIAASNVARKSPLSTAKLNALVIGVAGMKLRRRRSKRSNPHCRAAVSIRRSMMLTASANPGPRVTPTGVVLVSTARTRNDIAGIAVDRALKVRILVGLHPARRAGHVGAEVGDAVHVQREEMALGIQRQGGVREVVASLMIAQKRLRSRGDPFHRPSGAAGRPQDQGVLGIGEILRAEAAADIRGDEANRCRIDAEGAGGDVAVAVDVLAGHMQGVAAVVPGRRRRRPRAAPSGW